MVGSGGCLRFGGGLSTARSVFNRVVCVRECLWSGVVGECLWSGVVNAYIRV